MRLLVRGWGWHLLLVAAWQPLCLRGKGSGQGLSCRRCCCLHCCLLGARRHWHVERGWALRLGLWYLLEGVSWTL